LGLHRDPPALPPVGSGQASPVGASPHNYIHRQELRMRVVNFFVGVLLMPVCVAITLTLASLVRAAHPASDAFLPPAVMAFGAGFLIWLILYFTLPPPVRTYVLAHELTHALWGSFMGASISRMKISKERGSVTLSKSNFLITLAPYFFPLYTIIVIIVYCGLSLFYDTTAYHLLWLGLVGFTWSFHFTFTMSALMQSQTDLKEYGYLFSYTVIYIFNVLGIAIWIIAVTDATFEQLITSFVSHIVVIWRFLSKEFIWLTKLVQAKSRQ
jgi:hypothetical protein